MTKPNEAMTDKETSEAEEKIDVDIEWVLTKMSMWLAAEGLDMSLEANRYDFMRELRPKLKALVEKKREAYHQQRIAGVIGEVDAEFDEAFETCECKQTDDSGGGECIGCELRRRVKAILTSEAKGA